MLERFLHAVDITNKWLGKMMSFTVLVLLAVVVTGVVARYVFDHPFLWTHETSTFIFGIYIVLGGGYVLALRQHINVDIVYQRFSVRTKAIVDIFTGPFFFIFGAALLWQTIDMSWTSLQNLEHAATAWCPPVYPFKVFLPIGSFLLLMQGLVKFIRDSTMAVTGEKSK